MLKTEEKFELLKMLLERGVEVRTYYRNWRVVSVERLSDSYVVIYYNDGTSDKMTTRHFNSRRFVAIL